MSPLCPLSRRSLAVPGCAYTLEGSAFARVLGRLMAAHLPRAVDEEKALELAEWCGYDPEVFWARLAGDPDANLGELSRLANELGLSESEREVLVIAYAFEREPASNEEEDEFDYLTEKVDVSPEEAERILADEDLFLIPPGTRYGYEPQEAMEVWAEAQDKLNHLSEAASDGDLFGNVGVSMLLWDAASRAAVLRKRTEERVRETSAE